MGLLVYGAVRDSAAYIGNLGAQVIGAGKGIRDFKPQYNDCRSNE